MTSSELPSGGETWHATANGVIGDGEEKPQVPAEVVEAFWSALYARDVDDADAPYVDEEIDVVDGSGLGVLRALLAAGWTPPDGADRG